MEQSLSDDAWREVFDIVSSQPVTLWALANVSALHRVTLVVEKLLERVPSILSTCHALQISKGVVS
jgi:hypothetical protein